jgi:hypothetical protein
MIWRRNGQQRVPPELLVIDERLIFARKHYLLRYCFEANRPIIRIGHMLAPCISVKIVDQVAAAHNQKNALVSQRRELLAQLKMK